jgi:hypothetical protein
VERVAVEVEEGTGGISAGLRRRALKRQAIGASKTLTMK